MAGPASCSFWIREVRRAASQAVKLIHPVNSSLPLSHLFSPSLILYNPSFTLVSLFSQQICASVSFDICIDVLTERGFSKVTSQQPKCAVQEKVLLAYRMLRRPIHIILKQLESRTSIPCQPLFCWGKRLVFVCLPESMAHTYKRCWLPIHIFIYHC